jgi:plasmid stabilization system protein ParE
MYSIKITELAHEDLRKIVTYIQTTLYSQQAASNLMDEVKKCYKHLKTNPYIYALCNDRHLYKEKYRKVIIKKYVLVFRIDEDKKVVTIYRFFYGAEDYPNKI